jgi:hypothetical protein
MSRDFGQLPSPLCIVRSRRNPQKCPYPRMVVSPGLGQILAEAILDALHHNEAGASFRPGQTLASYRHHGEEGQCGGRGPRTRQHFARGGEHHSERRIREGQLKWEYVTRGNHAFAENSGIQYYCKSDARVRQHC